MNRQLVAFGIVLLTGAAALTALVFLKPGASPVPLDPDTGAAGVVKTPSKGDPRAGGPSGTTGHAVVVVDALDGRAIPAAEVSVLAAEPGTAALAPEDRPADQDVVTWVERNGRTVFADEQGRVELPAFLGSAFVVVRKEQTYGSLQVSADEPIGDHRVEVRPRFPLTVKVVDAAGEPVSGVDVVLFEERPWGLEEIVRRSVEGTDGLAAFGDVRDRFGRRPHARAGISVDLPLAIAPRLALNLDEPSARPLRLVLPAIGSVRFDVLDDDGRPLGDDAAVLRISQRLPSSPGGKQAAPALTVPVRGGRAVAQSVGVGTRLEVHLVLSDGTVSAQIEMDGPTGAGEEIVQVLSPGGARPDLLLRVVGSSGEGVTGVQVRAEWLAGPKAVTAWGPPTAGMTATSDAQGHVTLEPDLRASELGGRFLRVGTTSGGAAVQDLAVVELPAEVSGRVADIGAVRIVTEMLIASGQVLGTERQPVGAAEVAVLVEQDGKWVRQPELVTVTDTRGRFKFVGRPQPGVLRLQVECLGHLQEGNVPFRAGSADLLVRLVRTGGLRGSIRAGSGLVAGAVELVLLGEAVRGVAPSGQLVVLPDRTGTFRYDGLRPGVATLVVRLQGSDAELRRVERLDIEAGGTCEDGRIQQIDVASDVRAHTLNVFDPDRVAVVGAIVWFRPAGLDGAWRRVTTNSDGACSVPAIGGTLDVMVGHPGFRYAKLQEVGEDRRVVLRRADESRVEVQLAPGVRAPRPPVELRAQLVWLGPPGEAGDDLFPLDDPRNATASQRKIDARSSTVLGVYEPGQYRVQLWIAREGADSGGTGVPSRSAQVTITETAQRIVVQVDVDAEVLDRLIQAVRSDER